jgi:hypothetical protein
MSRDRLVQKAPAAAGRLRHEGTQARRVACGGLLALLALCLLGSGLAYAQSGAPDTPDAVIELWEQNWTQNADGGSVYHEKKHVRLNNERAHHEFADPRITYNVDTDQLDILVARTKLPDGTYRELPPYAHVEVSPDASAGWPAFAGLRQHLLVMSGIEPGCVLEVEYKITSKPGARRHLAADLRVDSQYPIRERAIGVNVPPNAPLRCMLTPAPDKDSGVLVKPFHWKFTDLPGAEEEAQTPPWQMRCPRLVFSTAGLASEWLKDRTAQLDAAADKSELIAKLAAEWTKDRQGPADKLRGLQEKLAASFQFVEFDPAWRPAQLRPASEVLRSNYGLPEEAAAALLALARAANLPVMPGLLVHDATWNHEVPQDGMVAAYVVLLMSGRPGEVRMLGEEGDLHGAALDTGDCPGIWEPRRGHIVREGRWAGYTLLPVPDVLTARTSLAPWATADENRCQVSGKVTLSEDGNYAGTLSVRTTGLFATSEGLRAADAQKSRVSALLGRVLPDTNVESFVVKTLAAGEFEVTAQVKSSKPLKKTSERYTLRLAQEGPFQADVPLPLAPSRRDTPVRLSGPFDETLDLTIEWPEKWQVEVQPAALVRVDGEWGAVEQSITPGKHSLALRRRTRVAQADLSAADFLALRRPLNELQSEYSRTLVLRP